MNAITNAEAPPLPTTNPLVPTSMDQAIRLAEMMARGKMLPAHLQNSPGDCLMVVEQAMRWGMSPFAVAQCTSSIKGKLMFEGKLVAAAIECSDAIVGLLDYQFSGAGNERKITVTGTRRGEASSRTVEIVFKDAATDNTLWRKQPDQQLVYHGARVWGRRWTPGVVLGVYSREEFAASGEPFDGVTIDAAPEAQPEPAATEPAAPRKATVTEWLDALAARLDAAQTAQDVDAIAYGPDVEKAQMALKNGALERMNALVKAALDRTAEEAAFPGDYA